MTVPKRTRSRNRLDIMGEILEITSTKPVLRTQIMYKASLSFLQLKEYLSIMLELKLLEVIQDEDSNRKAYRITGKGLHVLSSLNEIKTLLGKNKIGELKTVIQKGR